MRVHTRVKYPIPGYLGGEYLAGSDPWQEAESKEQREQKQQVVGGAGFITCRQIEFTLLRTGS